ncbi:hypothetical protein V8D89_006546 [Ganoderma adspersum]
MFGSSIMRVVYGLEVDEEPVDYLKMAEDTMAIFSETLQPGKYLIEFLPFLRYLPSWVPGATVKRKGVVWRRVIWKLVEEPWKFVMASMKLCQKEGTARPSMVASLMADMRDQQPYGERADVSEEEDLFRGTAATAYAVFFLAMATHLRVLKTAQAELDAVVGPHWLPNFEDMKSLPYICALVKELLRWRIVGPLNFPHCVLEDDEYNGGTSSRRVPYLLPTFGNNFPPPDYVSISECQARSISRDPNVYHDPETFLPERFLKDRELDPDVRDPTTFAFGYGRRHPEPFECVIKPRSEEAVALVKANCGNLMGFQE